MTLVVLAVQILSTLIQSAVATFSFNGADAIAINKNNDIMATVATSNPDDFSCRINIKTDAPGLTITLDSMVINDGDSIHHLNCQRQYTLVVRNDADTLSQQTVMFTSLPIVCLSTGGKTVTSNEYTKAHLAITDAQKRTNGTETYESDIKVKLRGATAAVLPKKSFNISLDKSADIFGIRNDDKWILDAMAVDLSRMRNRLCFDLWNEVTGIRDNDMIRNGTKGTYVEVVINGEYNGVYCMSDKVNRKLLGLKKAETTDDGSCNYKGLLYKCSTNAEGTSFLKLPVGIVPNETVMMGDWELDYPDDYPSAEAWETLYDFLKFTSNDTISIEQTLAELPKYINEDALNRYLLFIMAVRASDNCVHNSYLSVKNVSKDNKLWITPWDLDGTFGRDGWATLVYTDYATDILWNNDFMTKLAESDSVKTSLKMLWDEWRETSFAVTEVEKRIDGYAALLELSGAWARELTLWQDYYSPIIDRQLTLEDTPETECSYMKEWYAKRFDVMDRYFAPAESGIHEIAPSTSPCSRSYNLQGIAVSSTYRGLIIKDGKKYLNL